jgi:hypothetical protein
MRKAAHEGLNKGVVKDFHETQTKEALLLAAGGLAEPAQWDKHIRRSAASMILSVVYDQPTIKSEQDHNIEPLNEFVQRLARAAYPGAHFVEFFPWMLYNFSRYRFQNVDCHCRRLIWTRCAQWKRDAERWYEQDSATFESFFKLGFPGWARNQVLANLAAWSSLVTL